MVKVTPAVSARTFSMPRKTSQNGPFKKRNQMMRKVKSQEVESKPPHFKPATKKKNDKYFPEKAHGKLFAKIL